MLKIDKNNYNKWNLLLQVLQKEIPENDPLFQAWLQEDIENEKLYQSLKEGNGEAGNKLDKDKVYTNISNILSFEGEQVPFYGKNRLGYVAAIILLISSGVITYYMMNKETTPETIVYEQPAKNMYDPGSKKAYLLSAQGETIDLSETFLLEREDGAVISNDTQGIVSFGKNAGRKKEVEYHTIYVPKGGEYELLLADGSKVFLNSETRLTFPSYFEGDIRKVDLIGEAYFEVRKESKPFIVQTSDLQIRVLGTTFNVNAYQNESSVNTTLVEGSVQVNTNDHSDPFLLKPGHHLNLNKSSNEVSIQKVDTDIYTAWTKGEFIFRNQSLDKIFSQLARWYDFTIEYDHPSIKHMKFTGSAEKVRTLDYLLNQIESVTDIKYKDEGNKIIMYK